MLLFVSRIVIASYFLFSAINKVFFFGIFSRFLSSFTGVDILLSSIAATVVILLEFLFSALLLWSNNRMIIRGLALVLSVPFIIYNAYVYFVLNYQSCNCSFSTSGESLTHPLFSIFVLTLTLLVSFLPPKSPTWKSLTNR